MREPGLAVWKWGVGGGHCTGAGGVWGGPAGLMGREGCVFGGGHVLGVPGGAWQWGEGCSGACVSFGECGGEQQRPFRGERWWWWCSRLVQKRGRASLWGVFVGAEEQSGERHRPPWGPRVWCGEDAAWDVLACQLVAGTERQHLTRPLASASRSGFSWRHGEVVVRD